jgi:hypothetical protein
MSKTNETDPLIERLRQADADAGVPLVPAGLAVRAMLIAARRRRGRQRRWATGIAAGILLLIGVSWPWRGTDAPPSRPAAAPSASASDAGWKSAIARLEAEAESHVAVGQRVAELQAQQVRLAALEAESAGPDPVLATYRELDQTASVLVAQGDRLYRELGLKASAAERYRRVIRLFPEAPGAAVARQRLTQLEEDKGDVL